MAERDKPKGPAPTPEAPATLELGGRTYHIDKELTAVLQSGIPAVLTSCRHGREVIKQENLFLVSDHDGNLYPGCGCGMGLYASDTRFLSGWVLKLEDQVPTLLASSAERNYLSQIEFMNQRLVLDGGQEIPQESLYISSLRLIENHVREQLRVVNFNPERLKLRFSIEFRADYSDIFEVRGMHRQAHGVFFRPTITEDEILLSYMGEDRLFRQTRIHFINPPPGLSLNEIPTEHNATGAIALFELGVDGKGAESSLEFTVETLHGHADERPESKPFKVFIDELYHAQKERMTTIAPTRLHTNHELYNLILDRSIRDLASLTTFYETGPYISAGIPWFTAPFGRDGIITALQSLMLGPELAIGTLRYLAKQQGTDDNPFRDETPGKILHEVRFGELARVGKVPHTPYYGAVDSTPLFLILLSETYRWTGDLGLVKELWDSVEAALMWLDGYGDLDGDGFVEYERRSPVGLVVQGWKDSVNSVIFPDATLARDPVALVEVQGYVYDAKRRIAQLCYLMDLRILGDRLVREAEKLKESFNATFWLPQEGFYAEALDGSKRPVNTMTSNPGHCLWSGIIAEDRIATVAQQMVAPDMFNGWGIRTMSSNSPVYNPLSYHNGTVWPHDTSIVAKGMADYGFKDETLKVFEALYQAALHFPYYRLPELFCGFAKQGELDKPVPYPVACSPQAWAAGTPMLMLQSVLGIIPDAATSSLRIVQPTLPPWLEEVKIENLRVGDSELDLQFIQYNGVTTARVLRKKGRIKVLIEG